MTIKLTAAQINEVNEWTIAAEALEAARKSLKTARQMADKLRMSRSTFYTISRRFYDRHKRRVINRQASCADSGPKKV